MSIIQDKYNIRFDFETNNLNVPIDASLFRNYDLDHKAFVANYIAVAGGQLFDGNKTVYKFKEGEFYLTVYFEQPQIGLLFVPNKGDYTEDYLEKLQIYCDFKKIKLIIINLFARGDLPFPQEISDRVLEINISGKDKLDVLDEKIKNLMSTLIELYTNKFLNDRKAEIYEQMDKELCYRLGILFSIYPKKTPENVQIMHGRIV